MTREGGGGERIVRVVCCVFVCSHVIMFVRLLVYVCVCLCVCVPFPGEKIGQGKDKTKAYLEEHPEVSGALEAKLRHLMATGAMADGTDTGGSDEPSTEDIVDTIIDVEGPPEEEQQHTEELK